MPASTEPRGELFYGWVTGESGYGDNMNTNLLRLSRFAMHPSIINKITNTPPVSPVNGDGYIIGSAPTGVWTGLSNDIAIWDGTAWIFETPKDGWYVRNTSILNTFEFFNGTIWISTSFLVGIDDQATGIVMTVTDTEITAIVDLLMDLGKQLQFKDSGSVFRGGLLATSGAGLKAGIALVNSPDGIAFDTNSGAVVCAIGAVEIYGAEATLHGLNTGQTDNRQVFCTPDGTLYSVSPPPTGWFVSDTDNALYNLPTLATWVKITGLTVTVPQDLALGDRLDLTANLHVIELSGNRDGTIDISYGINGAQPTGAGVNKFVSPGFDSLIPISIVTTTVSLTSGDTLDVWARRSTQGHNQFNLTVDGTTGAGHELSASTPSGSGGAQTGLIRRTTDPAITAFATGGQASAYAITKEINNISVSATAGDSVKLPPALSGYRITVINNGAAACDVFPDTGDNLGAGVNIAASLVAGAVITYVSYDATNWIAA